MIKVVGTDSFSFDEPTASLMDVHSRGVDKDYMTKRASVFSKEIKDIKPEQGHSYIHLISLGAGESFSCFPAGTQVRMGDGDLKSIESISTGEVVINRLGRLDRVITKYERDYKGELVVLNVAGALDTIKATPNHKFYVIPKEQVICVIDKEDHCKPGTMRVNKTCDRRTCARTHIRFDPKMVQADELKEGDYVLQAIPDARVGLRTHEWPIPLARVIGYFLAEGSFASDKKKDPKNPTQLRFAFGLHELGTVVADCIKCADLLKTYYGDVTVQGPYNNADKGTSTVVIRSKALAIRVQKAIGEYSYGKQLNGEVYWQAPEILKHLIACWIDGDGTHPKYERPNGYEENRYTGTTVSKRLALDLQWILTRLDAISSVCLAREAEQRVIFDRVCDCRTLYHVSFSNAAGEFMRGINFKHRSVPPLQNKQHSFIWNGFVCRPIREITKEDFLGKVYNIEVENDHTYTVNNGFVAGNCNRNGDWFNEKAGSFELPEPKEGVDKFVKLAGGLVEFHPTFMKGHVFRHHHNEDPKKAIGEIKYAAFNPDMHRGELIIKVPHGKEWDAELHKMANGISPAFSMACREPSDRCSICGNIAPSRSFYCDHLKNHMTELTKEGHQVFAINDQYNFFDISKVFKPADRIAWGLAKVASSIQGGAELAESYGLAEALSSVPKISKHAAAKRAIARKLADIEKTIEAQPTAMLSIAGGCPQQEMTCDPVLKKHPLSNVMGALSNAKIAMPLSTFLELVMGDAFGNIKDQIKDAESALPGMFSRMCGSDLDEAVNSETYDSDGETPVTELRNLMNSMKDAHSLESEPVHRRVTITIIRGVCPQLAKQGSDNQAAAPYVREYAKYLLSFVKTSGAEESVPLLTVLRNYRKV